MKNLGHIVRSRTPLSLRKALYRVGNSLGTGLPELVSFPDIKKSLKILYQLGFRPDFCVDIGAYHGEFTACFREVFPDSSVLMIEAQESKRSALQKIVKEHPAKISVEIKLLGPTDEQIVDFIEMETGSSVFEETSIFPRTTIKKTTSRLDSLLAKANCPHVDFLKLDVQGYELQILEGASVALSQASAVLMEASLIAINRGCPLMPEVVAYMDRSGFRLFDFCSQTRRKDGVLWQTDLLFIRSDSTILPSESLTHDNWG